MPPITTTIGTSLSPLQVWESLCSAGLEILHERILHESELKVIADGIVASGDLGVVFSLIEAIPQRGTAYDWNVGSILQHLDQELVIDSLRLMDKKSAFQESIGLSYVFGTHRRKDPFAVDFLRSVIDVSGDSEAWWMAAFALQKLGEGNAVGILKQDLIKKGLLSFGDYLDSLHDKRSVIGILLTCSKPTQVRRVQKRIVDELLKATDRRTTVDCCWLAGRLRCATPAIKDRLKDLVHSQDHETQYHASCALQRNATHEDLPFYADAMKERDPLVRKMTVRGLLAIGIDALPILEQALADEKEAYVVTELTRAITALRAPIEVECIRTNEFPHMSENGLSSMSGFPAEIIESLAEAEDPADIHRTSVAQWVGCGMDDVIEIGLGVTIEERDMKCTRPLMYSHCVLTGLQDPLLTNAELQRIHEAMGPEDTIHFALWDTQDALGDFIARHAYGVSAHGYLRGARRSHFFKKLESRTRRFKVPLRFLSLTQAAATFGRLFGRDAGEEIVSMRRFEWEVSTRIVQLSKSELGTLIQLR